MEDLEITLNQYMGKILNERRDKKKNSQNKTIKEGSQRMFSEDLFIRVFRCTSCLFDDTFIQPKIPLGQIL